MKISNYTSAKQIAQYLRQQGFGISEISEPGEMEDGVVGISGTMLHVQVGFGYAGVVVENKDNTFTFVPNRKTVDELIRDIRLHGNF